MSDLPFHHRGFALLSPDEMAEADRLTIEAGTPGINLMERAGAEIVRVLRRYFLMRPVVVLAGPGNNGGDGYVVARLLQDLEWPVSLVAAVPDGKLRGDALLAASRWMKAGGKVLGQDDLFFTQETLVIDAVLGAGLDRGLEDGVEALFERVRRAGSSVLAIDLPSGVAGGSGTLLGSPLKADVTVSFFRGKPAHLLEPGRNLCGVVEVVDIGIPATVLEEIQPKTAENGPGLWRDLLPAMDPSAHKYDRGHVIVATGQMAGAATLVCDGARASGAGYVTAVSEDASIRQVLTLSAPGVVATDKMPELDPVKAQAVVIGPGSLPEREVGDRALGFARTSVPVVIDAGALSGMAERPETLADREGEIVLTPHEGEFATLFPDLKGDKLTRARAAAALTQCTVVLKGRDTVIAAADGRAAINGNAPPALGSAGTGDVLAGMVGAALANGLPGFEAACWAVYAHGAAANRALGPVSGSGQGALTPEALAKAIAPLQPAS